MPSEITRSTRVEARIAPDVPMVVRRAAEIQGRSVSDLTVVSAQEAADRAIEAAQIIRLSVEDQRRFADALVNPPALSPALKRAARAHKKLIASAP